MKRLKFALTALALSASAGAIAGPGLPDGGWYGFCFNGGVGNPAFAGGCRNDGAGESGNPITFTLANAGTLNVTDAFLFGDTFDVYVNAVFAFTTSGGSHLGAVTANPDVAFGGGAYDQGSVALAAGQYTVGIFTRATPRRAVGVAGTLRVVDLGPSNAVSEPGALSLAGLALLGLAAARRRAKA